MEVLLKIHYMVWTLWRWENFLSSTNNSTTVPCWVGYNLATEPSVTTLSSCVILYIKMNVCLFVCLFVPYTNPHFWTDRNQTLHTAPLWSGRDRRVCIGPKFLTSSTFWTIFSFVAAAELWVQDGCRRDRFPLYTYIRDSSWCSRDVTDITLSLAAESSAAVLYPWF
jgi:hypothetical protein